MTSATVLNVSIGGIFPFDNYKRKFLVMLFISCTNEPNFPNVSLFFEHYSWAFCTQFYSQNYNIQISEHLYKSQQKKQTRVQINRCSTQPKRKCDSLTRWKYFYLLIINNNLDFAREHEWIKIPAANYSFDIKTLGGGEAYFNVQVKNKINDYITFKVRERNLGVLL